MAYCPECGAEYRDGFNRCDLCDTDLIDGHPEGIGQEEGVQPHGPSRFFTREPGLSEGEARFRAASLAWVAFLSIAVVLLFYVVYNAVTWIGEWNLSYLPNLAWYPAMVIAGLQGFLLLLMGIAVVQLDRRHRRTARKALWVASIAILIAVAINTIPPLFISLFSEGQVIERRAEIFWVFNAVALNLLFLTVGAAAVYLLSGSTVRKGRGEGEP